MGRQGHTNIGSRRVAHGAPFSPSALAKLPRCVVPIADSLPWEEFCRVNIEGIEGRRANARGGGERAGEEARGIGSVDTCAEFSHHGASPMRTTLSSAEKAPTPADDFARRAEQSPTGFLGEFTYFVAHNKKRNGGSVWRPSCTPARSRALRTAMRGRSSRWTSLTSCAAATARTAIQLPTACTSTPRAIG